MNKFTDKEILEFANKNLSFIKDASTGELQLSRVLCDVDAVDGDVGYVDGNVRSVDGNVGYVYGAVRSVDGDVGAVRGNATHEGKGESDE